MKQTKLDGNASKFNVLIGIGNVGFLEKSGKLEQAGEKLNITSSSSCRPSYCILIIMLSLLLHVHCISNKEIESRSALLTNYASTNAPALFNLCK